MTGRVETKPGRILEISSVANPAIKKIRGLSLKKNRDAEGVFVAEGMKLIIDAFENGWEVETLVHAAKLSSSSQVQEIAAKARVKGAQILQVSEKVLSSITRKDNPQMMIGVMRQAWADVAKAAVTSQSAWLALDRVRDPGNLGSIIRTVDAAGADGVILVGDCTDPYSLESVRASMGSIFNVPLVRMTVEEFLGWRICWSGMVIGTHLEGAVDYRSLDYQNAPVLLLMGNEQHGLPDNLSGACDHLVYIPMAGSADSLNLSVATGVVLFQMAKRTGKGIMVS